MGNDQGKLLDTTTPEGVRAMDEQLQRKFSKGIQYNMKVVIRGDRNTGKTCLLYRMQGKAFTERYIPTDEIQVAHIHWTYPGTNDTVKVEIWDVVDKGRVQKGKGRGNLKLVNDPMPSKDLNDTPLDGEFLDVFKGVHAVIFLYDITKQWTWQYVEREVERVPLYIPILVLGNFGDLNEHRIISNEDADFYITHLNRPDGAAEIRYTECCMKNGYGLRYLHKFLSIPFLQMQQESLLHQLKVNREQILIIQEELDEYKAVQTYDQFVTQGQRLSNDKQNKDSEQAPPTTNQTPPTIARPSPTKEHSHPVNSTDGSTPESNQTDSEPSLKKKFSAKFSGFLTKSKQQQPSKPLTPKSPRGTKQSLQNVDDFAPEGELDDQFFDDEGEDGEDREGEEDGESDSDADYNPQVTLDEDLSSIEDEEEEKKNVKEEEEEEEEEEDEEEEKEEIVTLTPMKVNSVHTIPPLRPIEEKKKPPPLKSVHDIVISESEEEEERPVVMRDEDLPKKELVTKPLAKEPKDSRKTSGGLLLAFKETPPAKQKNKEVFESPSERKKKSHKSPRGDRESKHKKHRKKSKLKDNEKEEEKKEKVVQQTDEDPFGLSSSLDAWLTGDYSPTVQSRSTHDMSRKIRASIEEEEEEEERSHKTKKKHRSEEDVERKKRKSKRKPSDLEVFYNS